MLSVQCKYFSISQFVILKCWWPWATIQLVWYYGLTECGHEATWMTLGSCSHRICHHYQLEHLACADKNTLAFTPQWYEHLLVWRSWVQSRYFLWKSLCSFPLGENCHDELASILLCSSKEKLRKMQKFWLNWMHYMITSWNWKTTCGIKLVVMF